MVSDLPDPPPPVTPKRTRVPNDPALRKPRPAQPQDDFLAEKPARRSVGWMITVAVLIGGRMLAAAVDGGSDPAEAGSACVDADAFAEEMSALDTWFREVNHAVEA